MSVIYESQVPFDESRIHTAAVYCSDGRFGEQIDDLLQSALGLPYYDRLAVPGGPACLAGHAEASREQESAVIQLRFLIEVHELERVVLICHQHCAFYSKRLGLVPGTVETQQRKDMLEAARKVRELADVEVEMYFARKSGSVIQFERFESE